MPELKPVCALCFKEIEGDRYLTGTLGGGTMERKVLSMHLDCAATAKFDVCSVCQKVIPMNLMAENWFHTCQKCVNEKRKNVETSFGVYRAEWLRRQKIHELHNLFTLLAEGLNNETRIVNVREGHYPPAYYGIVDVFGLGLGFDKETNTLYWGDKK
jgi:hypothetical protein